MAVEEGERERVNQRNRVKEREEERELERRVHTVFCRCLLISFSALLSSFYSGNFLLSRVPALHGVSLLGWDEMKLKWKFIFEQGKWKGDTKECQRGRERGREHMIGLCESSWESDMWHQLNANAIKKADSDTKREREGGRETETETNRD